jgi:hypothetical protein
MRLPERPSAHKDGSMGGFVGFRGLVPRTRIGELVVI